MCQAQPQILLTYDFIAAMRENDHHLRFTDEKGRSRRALWNSSKKSLSWKTEVLECKKKRKIIKVFMTEKFRVILVS